MNAIQQILVPTDFSEPAARAFEIALALAKKLGARVTLLHASPATGLDDPRFPDGAIRRVSETIASMADRARNQDGDVVSLLVTGEASEQILEVAAECHADLIVMGTHGRTGVLRAILGSVAEKVVRLSRVPVITTGAATERDAKRSPLERLQDILVSTDFSPPADRARDLAIDLAQKLGGKVTLFHCFVPPQMDYGMGTLLPMPELEQAAKQALDEAVAAAKTRFSRVDGVLGYGQAAQCLEETVAELGIGVVVIGTHGKGWIRRALLGSVANKVIRTSVVPVLSVPASPNDSEKGKQSTQVEDRSTVDRAASDAIEG